MTAVAIDHLTKKYGTLTAVNNLTLQIDAGQIYGFLGPDGAGKTSLFRMLCGILTPTAGRAGVLGFDVVRDAERLKQELGYMAQKFSLYMDLTVRENLDFFADLFKTPYEGLSRRKLELLTFAGLDRFQDRLAGNLSGGMKQKLALCCTLIHTPRILILDEPTTGVDPVSRQEFWEMIKPLPAQGTTVIVSTAYMDEAAKCDRIAMMNLGHILKTGTPVELKAALRGKIFEIRGADMNKAESMLPQLNWLKDIQPFGDRLHVRLEEGIAGEEGLQRLTDALRDIGPDVGVNPVEASLEDVFIDLLHQNS